MVVAAAAYGEPGTPDDAAIRARLRMVAAGGAVALARHRSSGEAAGSGQVGVPYAGVTELAAVGTGERFRNQGVAGAITALLTRDAFARGVELLWLTAEGPQAARIYARVGFRPVGGHMIHISVPETATRR
jgi:predicted GNAT family acetyltransferase